VIGISRVRVGAQVSPGQPLLNTGVVRRPDCRGFRDQPGRDSPFHPPAGPGRAGRFTLHPPVCRRVAGTHFPAGWRPSTGPWTGRRAALPSASVFPTRTATWWPA
jgi:hypothetical protein